MSRSARDSKAARRAVALALAAGMTLFGLCLGRGAAAAQASTRPVIARILFLLDIGQARPETSDLITLKPGDPYSFKVVRDSVLQLFKSGLFSDVRVQKSGDQDVTLTFLLVRKLTVRSVKFQAPPAIPTKNLEAGLSALKPGMDFEEDGVGRAESEIKESLKQAGYFDSGVRTVVERDPQAPAVDLTFVLEPGRMFRVDRLVLSGDVRLPANDIRKRLSNREGQPFVPAAMERDRAALEDYYRSLGYQQARVVLADSQFHQAEGTVTLGLRLEAGERVEVVVRGAKVPLDLLTPIWQERVFEDWGLAEGESRILSYLRQKGYLFAIVSSTVERQGNALRAIYDVEPGDKYHIRSVVFEGMLYFSVKELQTSLGFQEGLFSLGGIGGELVFALPQQIESLYRSQGFSRAGVNLDFYRKGHTVTAIFALNEGPQLRINDVSIVGTTQVDASRLLGLIDSRAGGPYFQPSLQRDVETLRAFYLNQGFRGTKIDVAATKRTEELFSVVFSVEEGQQVRVEKIVITGEKVTRRSTILRELKIREGDVARQDAILETKRSLERLGIFSEVRLEEVPLGPQSISLVINLREGERNYAGLGLGLETENAIQSAAVWNNSLSPRITAEFIRSNMFGDAAQLSLAGQFSLRVKRGVVAFEQPHLFNMILQNSVEALVEWEQRTSYTFDRQGVSFNAVKPIFKDMVLMATLQYARTTLTALSIAPNAIDRQFSPYSKTSLSVSLSRDRRDDPFNPRRGSFASVAVEWAYPIFGVESDFQKLFLKYQQYWPLATRLNFNALFRVGLGRGLMPIHERFFAGGSNSFRGEYFDELGPRDPVSGQPVGGKLLALMNFELTVPFLINLPNLSWLLLYDVGNVFASRSDFKLSNIEHALGFGFRYLTPLGPLRFEVGLNLNPPGEGRKVIPFISVGNMF